MSMIDNSRSALTAFQTALTTTAHNIANVNTEGYSRQIVNLSARSTDSADPSASGAGVIVDRVSRAYDQSLTENLRSSTTLLSREQTYVDLVDDIDNMLASTNTGLSAQGQVFFNSLQDVANDPGSIPSRQVFISNADALASRFQTMDYRLSEIESTSNARLSGVVRDINDIAGQIATVNGTITASGNGGTAVSGDLLDTRDQLLKQLAEKVAVQTVMQPDQSASVFIGSGQSLVIGPNAQRLAMGSGDYTGYDNAITFVSSSSSSDITRLLTGGEIGGILEFQGSILRPAQSELGRYATVLTTSINAQHQVGYGLDDDMTAPPLGRDLFTNTTPTVSNHKSNSGDGVVVSAIHTSYSLSDGVISDLNSDSATDSVDIALMNQGGALKASDYQLERVAGVEQWQLTRLSDKSVVTIDAVGVDDYISADGFSFQLASGTADVGDRFLIRPYETSAEKIDVNQQLVDDPRKIAVASNVHVGPISRTAGTSDAAVQTAVHLEYTQADITALEANSTAISAGAVLTDVAKINQGAALISSDYQLTYDASDANGDGVLWQLNRLNADGSVGAAVALADVDSDGEFVTADGFSFRVSTGTEADADTFQLSIGGGVGDNSNIRSIIDLQKQRLVEGKFTFDDTYGQLVTSVGSEAATAKINMRAREVMLEQAQSARDSVSGVNLDEEAANLIRYQQAYEAAAKVMAATKDMFDTLMNVV